MASWRVGGVEASLVAQLGAELSGSELNSLLLEVMRRRAIARSPAELMAQARRDRLVGPAGDLRVALAVDGALLDGAAAFEAIELSPIAPLGVCSVVAPTDQHRVLSALRGVEVVSDPTNVLALLCAQRLQGGADGVHLATSHRVLRTQPVPDLPGYSPHFRMFALASAAPKEPPDHGFTVQAVVGQVAALLAGLERLEQLDGQPYTFGARRVEVLATAARASVGDRIAAALDAAGVRTTRDALAHPYYSGGVRYRLWATGPDGELPLGDGGTFDWLAALAGNRRAVFVASGLGSQLIPRVFHRPPEQRTP